MIEQKKKALADILAVDESEVNLGPFGYVVNNSTYEILCDKDEIDSMLESELAYEQQCAEEDIECSGCEWIIPYIDFEKYFKDNNFTLVDFGFSKYEINDVIYYVREV